MHFVISAQSAARSPYFGGVFADRSCRRIPNEDGEPDAWPSSAESIIDKLGRCSVETAFTTSAVSDDLPQTKKGFEVTVLRPHGCLHAGKPICSFSACRKKTGDKYGTTQGDEGSVG